MHQLETFEFETIICHPPPFCCNYFNYFCDREDYEIQENEIQENEIQENEIQENEIQENGIQENGIQENEIQENEIQENEIHPCYFRTILFGSRIFNTINDIAVYLYKNTPFIKTSLDFISYQCLSVQSCMINQRIEPFEPNWVSIGWLYLDPIEYNYSLRTKMFSNITNESIINDQIKTFTNSILIHNLYFMIHPWLQIKTNFFKNESRYISRTINTFNTFDFSLENKKKKSSVRFLSVEYLHESMEKSISLTIDPAYLYEDNDIFMPSFILHLLEHQSEPFYFGMSYRLHIIDHLVNIIELKSNQYIQLSENSYEICDSRTEYFFEK